MGMSYGKAVEILDELRAVNTPKADVLAAISTVLSMETINAVSKSSLLNALRWMMHQREARILTAEDFADNPEVDACGMLPCWVECNDAENDRGVRMGIIEAGETIDGWTTASADEMPGREKYNPDVRYWTARPTRAQMEEEPWDP